MGNQNGLTQHLETKQVASQELQFSMKILQMSLIELKDYMYEAFVENPILEIDEYDTMETKEESNAVVGPREKEMIRDGIFTSSPVREGSPLDFISRDKTFTDYLIEQLSYIEMNQTMQKLCEYIVHSLDSRGYFKEVCQETATRIGVSLNDFSEALNMIRHLEPIGIGWNTLEESLIYQLEAKNIITEVHRDVINNHLEKVAKGNYNSIALKLNIPEIIVRQVVEDIKEMNPIPSRGFSASGFNNYIIPDANIEKIGDRLQITMNSRMLPKLRINFDLKEKDQKNDVILSRYLNDKLQNARLLMKTVDMRKCTMENVINVVIGYQDAYLMEKEDYLQPLSLKHVAQILEVHESTISRAVKEKYVNTPRGTLALKDLFSTSLTSGNVDVSSDYIRNLIRRLINEEESSKPLSDQKISELLNERGIEIKRRTVAKYRNEDGISSTKIRKETK